MKCTIGLAVLLLSGFLETALMDDKTECPERPLLEIGECSSGRNRTCSSDSDCSGKQKCCEDLCDRHCTDPVSLTALKKAPVIKGYSPKVINKFTQGILKMTCVVKAYSKFQLSWYKELIPVRPDLVHVKYQSRDGRKIVSQLRIKNVKCEDSGSYRCVARTESKYDEKYFRVTVYDRRKGYIVCPWWV